MIWTIVVAVVLVLFVVRLVRAMATVLLTLAVVGGIVVYAGGLDWRQVPQALEGTGISLPDPVALAATAGAWTLCALETVTRLTPDAGRDGGDADWPGETAEAARPARSACDGL